MAEAPYDRQHGSIGFDVQLLAQQGLVDLGVPQSTPGISGRGERRNQPCGGTRAVGVERRKPPPPLDGAPVLVALRRGYREALERLGDKPGQPRALRLDPALELGRCVRVVEVNAVEEGAHVQRDGALELRAGERHLQGRNVAVDQGWVEAQVGGAEEEVVGAQLATQGGQRLRQRMPGVLRVALGPEQGEQAIAAHTALSPRRKHSEQGQLAALRRRPGDRTALAGEREPAEGPEPEGHRPADLLLTSGCYSPSNIRPEWTCTRPKKCGLTGTCMRPCRLASGRADGDKSAGQQPKEGGGMLRRSRCALVFAVALAWGCDQDGATAPRAKTPPRPAALATAVGSITDLGNLPGASSAQGFAINDRGQVVGCSYLQFCNLASGSRDPQRAVLWDPITQHLTDLSLPSTAPSEAFGINETGQVVGSVNSDGRRAFLWDPSTETMILISDPLTPGAEATAINGRGQVVGFGRIRGGLVDHAFLWNPDVPNGTTGTMTDLGTLAGGSGSAAFGVNDRGQVVGCTYTSFCDPANGTAFPWTPDVPNGTTGSMIELGTLPGGSGSEASGINNGGQVVGASADADGTAHAFLWTPGAPNGATGDRKSTRLNSSH